MRRSPSTALFAVALVSITLRAGAQVGRSNVSPSLVAGVALPRGDVSAYTNYGYTLGGAVDVSGGQLPVRVRAEAGYTDFSFYKAGVNTLDGTRNQWNGGVDLVVPIRARVVTPFLLGGAGVYQVSVRPECNQLIVDVNGAAPACPGGTSNHSGWTAGAGLDFPRAVLGTRVEIRYTRIAIPSGSYSYVPITFALVF